MNVKKGDFVRVRYDGAACGSFGVPKIDDGKRAKVLRVGRTRLTIMIEGHVFQRDISMTSARKVRK